MPEEHKTIEARLSASPEVYHMARFEKAFPWLLAGGAALVLLETYRKNTNDRAKANADIKAALKNQKHQTEVLKEQIRQFDENAFQERKAERRERYTKAVEQLGNASAPVRMGGVYTLIGLVDDWLEEKNLDYSERLKEGQVIINNLCAYIRSPFTLASHYDELSKANPTPKGIYKGKKEKFYADKATLDSEADVRLGIIKEIHDRLQSSGRNAPGAWSDFEYDFSGSTFFYPIDLTNSYYAKPINFSGSTYKGEADFSDSTYKSWADFSGSTYKGEADFSGSTYKSWADFSDSTYKSWADFSRSTYKSWADFSGSTYKGRAYFSDSTYKGRAYFSDSTYKSGANFTSSTYENETDFSGSIFYQEVYIGKNGDNGSFSHFISCSPQFYDKKKRKNTLFGSHNNNFTVDIDKGYPIDLDSKGIPLNCKFLTSEQKEYLADKFREIEKTNNKLLEVKDPKEKAELSKNLQALTEELHEWREEVTTVEVEDSSIENMES